MRQTIILMAAILFVSATAARAQQPDAKEIGPTLGTGFEELNGWITKAADMVPSDKYSYKPVPTVRTFGELVGHIVDGYTNLHYGNIVTYMRMLGLVPPSS